MARKWEPQKLTVTHAAESFDQFASQSIIPVAVVKLGEEGCDWTKRIPTGYSFIFPQKSHDIRVEPLIFRLLKPSPVGEQIYDRQLFGYLS